MRLEPVRLRWEARTTALNRDVMALAQGGPSPELDALKRRRAYAVARVARLRADIKPRLEGCGVESLPLACACGLVGAKKTCRQWWLCLECRARRAPQLSAGIRKGLQLALERETEKWGRRGGHGQRPQIILLTLTQKHSGDIVADQQAIATGWRALYKRMHERYGSFPYVGVWEATRGRDGLGHVHMHVAVIWGYRCWKQIRKMWGRACPTSLYLDIKRKRKDRKASSPASVANYLGKYLSKGADASGYTPTQRADISAAFYNQRSVLTSLHFWKKHKKCCSKCQQSYRLVEIEIESIRQRLCDLPEQTINLYFHGLEPPSEPPF